jgi:acyl phosphate:glycerol-3-phosphate acyltransferase
MDVAIVAYVLSAVVGYLLGSIPTGFLMGTARGIDIRTVGSGNIGATNVFRHLGVPAGIFVLLADAFKGWVAVILATELFHFWFIPGTGLVAREWLGIISGFSAILGHNFTCWLHFKGGKGIATSAGVLVALVPTALLTILGIWIIIFILTRYVSLASISAAIALPFGTWLTKGSLTMIAITALMAGLAIYKHKPNIQRLLKGTENRIQLRKSGAESKKAS